MKKTYIKPILQVEFFEVDAVMTEGGDLLPISQNPQYDPLLTENGGTINFNDTTLNSIDYQKFIK